MKLVKPFLTNRFDCTCVKLYLLIYLTLRRTALIDLISGHDRIDLL